MGSSRNSMFRFADGIDKLLLLFGILGSIGDGLMSPMAMYILSGIIDTIGASLSSAVINQYALKLFILAIGVGLSAFIEGVCWATTAERQTSRMRLHYLKSVLRQDVGFFDHHTTTQQQQQPTSTFQVVSTISSDAHLIQDVIADKIPNCLTNMSSFVFSIVVGFILSWRLTLTVLPFTLMFIVPGLVFGKLMMLMGLKANGAYEVAGGIAEQAISSIRVVYSFVGEPQTLYKFSQALSETMGLRIKQGLAKGFLMGSMGMIFATWAFQAWVGSILVIHKGESGGRVFIAGVCVILGGLAIMSALPNLSYFSEAKATATRMCEMIDRIPSIDSEEKNGKILSQVRGEILFRNVTFSYPSRPDNPVLRGLDLKIKAGKTTGLVGGSGSGKSTVISLLQRFYDPTTTNGGGGGGDIMLDGHKIHKLKLKWLRSQMGLVNQEPVLFATSIKENILFGKELGREAAATMDGVVSAAKAANAHDFIINLPQGYETHVGQFGFQLSGGQKQRIAIARALIRDPKILLLDEATSALDSQSERTVQEALDRASLGRTTIIVAHRLVTIRNAHIIIVLQSGRVVESGNHDELISRNNGAYLGMLQLQQQSSTQSQSQDISTTDVPHRHGRRRSRLPSPTAPSPNNWQSSSSFFTPMHSISAPNSYPFYYDDDETDDEEESLERSDYLRRLLKMSAPEWKRALLGCFGALCNGAVQPIYAYHLGSLVSVYFSNNHVKIMSETITDIVIFLGLAIVSFISNLVQHYNFSIMGERLTNRVREKMLQKMLTFEVSWFDRDENTSASICARLATEASLVRSLVADRMSLLVQITCTSCLAFAASLVITWRVSIVIIAIQPLVIGSFYMRNELMKSMSKKARQAQKEGSQLASEAVVNHRTITAFSSQKRILSMFKDTLEGPRKETVKLSWLAGCGLFCSQFMSPASIALTFWYGTRLMNRNLVAQKELFEVFFILMSTGKIIADTGSMTSDLSKGSSAIRSVFSILDRKTEIEPEDEEEEDQVELGLLKGRIELKNVFFSYPTRPNQMIFQGLSLKIQAGETVALVGQSGSGKSTVIGLIERFYDPLKGSVLIDGQDIKRYNLRSMRSQIALVSQEPTLFGGSIRENIMFGKEEATESEIKEAARLANADEFISSLKDGYNSYCGERGTQLSGGQKQRIALARAILKNPAILLLDEATSALDSVSESLVQKALEKMMEGRTCVVVAHRLSTIQRADSIVVIKNGKVAEMGSHDRLLSLGSQGSYYSLVNSQTHRQ
ncbi:putative multidrug resistance protein [Impatiens glandulifera]|uniref:putative multidrug resistance protein n=1 Tax=Impatiens glandulifera TaxID=253017 RepID=UPI001FB08929|nr:putative multidrug resistance protein [Impatiens glandulifera]